jgi:hypothetical protein
MIRIRTRVTAAVLVLAYADGPLALAGTEDAASATSAWHDRQPSAQPGGTPLIDSGRRILARAEPAARHSRRHPAPPAGPVRAVRRGGRGDSVLNGLLIGAGIGLLLGLSDEWCREYPQCFGYSAAIMGFTGAIIDAGQ